MLGAKGVTPPPTVTTAASPADTADTVTTASAAF